MSPKFDRPTADRTVRRNRWLLSPISRTAPWSAVSVASRHVWCLAWEAGRLLSLRCPLGGSRGCREVPNGTACTDVRHVVDAEFPPGPGRPRARSPLQGWARRLCVAQAKVARLGCGLTGRSCRRGSRARAAVSAATTSGGGTSAGQRLGRHSPGRKSRPQRPGPCGAERPLRGTGGANGHQITRVTAACSSRTPLVRGCRSASSVTMWRIAGLSRTSPGLAR